MGKAFQKWKGRHSVSSPIFPSYRICHLSLHRARRFRATQWGSRRKISVKFFFLMSSDVCRRRRHRYAAAGAGLTRALPSQLRFIKQAEHPPPHRKIKRECAACCFAILRSSQRLLVNWQHLRRRKLLSSLTRRVSLCILQLLELCSPDFQLFRGPRLTFSKSLMNSSQVKYKPTS